MANRAGLRKVVKTVRGKKGSVRRSYWVRAGDAVKSGAKAAGGFVGRHKGAIAGALALAAMAGIAHHGNSQYKKQFGSSIYSDFRGAGHGRVRSAAAAAGYGGAIGAFHIGGNVSSAVSSAKSRVANSDTAVSARIAATSVRGMYGRQRANGSGRARSIFNAIRGTASHMRG